MQYDSGALSPDENKPIKTVSKRTKRFLTAVLCIIIGCAIAAAAIFLFGKLFSGARTAEQAVAEYTKSALVYDVDGMIEYSSPYNKALLYGGSEPTDRLLHNFLTKTYAEIEKTGLQKENIKVTHISTVEYVDGDDKFAGYTEKYAERADASKVTAVSAVTMAVDNGTKEVNHTYIAVKIGLSWYYFYTEK